MWDYISRFAMFNRIWRIWGVTMPEEAAAKIDEQRRAVGVTDPQKLKKQATNKEIRMHFTKDYLIE